MGKTRSKFNLAAISAIMSRSRPEWLIDSPQETIAPGDTVIASAPDQGAVRCPAEQASRELGPNTLGFPATLMGERQTMKFIWAAIASLLHAYRWPAQFPFALKHLNYRQEWSIWP
jgi:hypothetical protein